MIVWYRLFLVVEKLFSDGAWDNLAWRVYSCVMQQLLNGRAGCNDTINTIAETWNNTMDKKTGYCLRQWYVVSVGGIDGVVGKNGWYAQGTCNVQASLPEEEGVVQVYDVRLE